MYHYFNWRENKMMEFVTDEELGKFQMEDYRSTIIITDDKIDDFSCLATDLPYYHPYWYREVERSARERVEMLSNKLSELSGYLKKEMSIRAFDEYSNLSEHYDMALDTYNKMINQRRVKQLHWSGDQS